MQAEFGTGLWMVLTEWHHLAGQEELIEERVVNQVEELLKLDYYKRITVDDLTSTILDGH